MVVYRDYPWTAEMTRTLENIPAESVSELLAKEGIDPKQKVTVIVEEGLADIARRTRKEAERRGMTAALFEEIMAGK